MGLRGTQLTGSIIYTLVSSPQDSTRIVDSGWISDLQIFDLINTWLLHIFKPSTWSFKIFFYLYCIARGFDEQAWQLWRIKRPVNCRNRYLSPTSNSIPLDLNLGNRSNPFFCRIQDLQRMNPSGSQGTQCVHQDFLRVVDIDKYQLSASMCVYQATYDGS
jgi:hypothetical protein